MAFQIIGGSDGPTSIFVAGKLGFGWFNLSGLIIVALILLPNIIYAFKFRGAVNKCGNKIMNILEQIGRYSSMLLMVFNIGISERGFLSLNLFFAYLIGNFVLIAAYWITWGMYFKKQVLWKNMVLAIIPTIIFLWSGITMIHVLLIVSGVIFGAAHIYVTYQNAKELE